MIIEIEKSNKNFEYRYKNRRFKKKKNKNNSLEIDSSKIYELQLIQILKFHYWMIIEIEKSNKNFEYRGN